LSLRDETLIEQARREIHLLGLSRVLLSQQRPNHVRRLSIARLTGRDALTNVSV